MNPKPKMKTFPFRSFQTMFATDPSDCYRCCHAVEVTDFEDVAEEATLVDYGDDEVYSMPSPSYTPMETENEESCDEDDMYSMPSPTYTPRDSEDEESRDDDTMYLTPSPSYTPRESEDEDSCDSFKTVVFQISK